MGSAYRRDGGSEATAPYDVAYALHLYNESRVHFLRRVEKQIQLDKLDNAYIAAADGHDEWVRRYKERFTINWWLLEHDAEAEWQKVESEQRFLREGAAYKAKRGGDGAVVAGDVVVGGVGGGGGGGGDSRQDQELAPHFNAF